MAIRLSALPRPLRLGPAHRAAHGVAYHGVKPGMEFCDRPGKTLTGQLGQRQIERGSLEREVACLGAIVPAGCYRLARLHAQGFFTRTHPEREVRQPRRPLELDLREIAESRHRSVEQGAQDPRCRSENSRQNCASSRRISGVILRNSTISARSRKSGLAVPRSGMALKTSGRVASKMASSWSL
jgi:hypothetical protein